MENFNLVKQMLRDKFMATKVDEMRLNLGIAIRRFRHEKGFTLAQLAKLCGVRTATLHNLETGKEGSIATLAKVCNVLNLQVQFKQKD